jgi:hypothetical protein
VYNERGILEGARTIFSDGTEQFERLVYNENGWPTHTEIA